MRGNGKYIVFNILNALEYLEEEVVDCSLICIWEMVVHKNLTKCKNNLEQELGKLDKDEPLDEGILSGPLHKSKETREPTETFKITIIENKNNAPSIEIPLELEL